MNCAQHEHVSAVAQCGECGRGLCSSCANVYHPPLCELCASIINTAASKQAWTRILYTCVLFLVGTRLGWSISNSPYGGPYSIWFFTLYLGAMVAGIPAAWRALSAITSRVFLILPLVGWLIYFLFKFATSLMIAPFTFSYSLCKELCTLAGLSPSLSKRLSGFSLVVTFFLIGILGATTNQARNNSAIANRQTAFNSQPNKPREPGGASEAMFAHAPNQLESADAYEEKGESSPVVTQQFIARSETSDSTQSKPFTQMAQQPDPELLSFGILKLQTMPNSTVIVDNHGDQSYTNDLGAISKKLAPGAHTILIIKQGYESNHLDVDIQEGQTTEIQVPLASSTIEDELGTSGLLTIQTMPDSFVVIDDGVITDEASSVGIFSTRLNPGSHKVRIAKSGCVTTRLSVEIKAGQIAKTMAPLSCRN